MLSKLFLGISLIGAEWVLYLLVLISILSVTIIVERIMFYRTASKGLNNFRKTFREKVLRGNWKEALEFAVSRQAEQNKSIIDMETEIALALLSHPAGPNTKRPVDALEQVARDAQVRTRLTWDRNLSVLATIGNNSPFVGLFGTVLGIMKAFHDLSQQAAIVGASGVTAGISEALVATAFGLLVAIPAVIAYNLFQRRVKTATSQAEALKSFIIGKLSEQ